jgi:hypothetical protein
MKLEEMHPRRKRWRCVKAATDFQLHKRRPSGFVTLESFPCKPATGHRCVSRNHHHTTTCNAVQLLREDEVVVSQGNGSFSGSFNPPRELLIASRESSLTG